MSLVAWLSLAAVCLLGAMSPGPSLAVILWNALRRGRSAALVAALSHGVAVALYGLITVAGLTAMVSGSRGVFTSVQVLGAVYLLYLGVRSMRSSGNSFDPEAVSASGGAHNAAADGFLVAFLNPKLAIFMLALFSQFLDPDSDWQQRWIMVATVGVVDAAWYCVLVLLVSHDAVLVRLRASSVLIDRLLGLLLVLLAFSVMNAALM